LPVLFFRVTLEYFEKLEYFEIKFNFVTHLLKEKRTKRHEHFNYWRIIRKGKTIWGEEKYEKIMNT